MNGYIEVKRLDHYGELAVPTHRRDETGAVEFILLNCKHGHHKVYLQRKDI